MVSHEAKELGCTTKYHFLSSANDEGVVEFTPLWAGRYVFEVTDMDKTPGQHNGKDYKATWKGATYSFEIK